MPDPLDTRDALRELVRHVRDIAALQQPCGSPTLDELRVLQLRLADPPPPARTVTRAQYLKALQRLEYDHDCDTDCAATLRDILTALDLRVADDATEAPHA